MARVELQYVPPIVNKAGKELARLSLGTDATIPSEAALQIISNWRSAHGFPLNTMKLWLLKTSRKHDKSALVAQRLKRISSIATKLNARPQMKLTQMQDIAGCRAILRSVDHVYRVARTYRRADLRHELVHIDDYIASPKESGYRGIHLVYRYRSDRKQKYSGMKVEIQIRSALQHAWATAVETVGIFTRQALKSSQGQTDWLRFFALMSSAIARRERTFPVPGVPDDPRILQEELRELCHKLRVETHLQLYADALRSPERVGIKGAHLFLMTLDPSAMKIRIIGFQKNQLEIANAAYFASEKASLSHESQVDSVLVSVDTFASLKRAYPNYFLDTHRFIDALNREIRPSYRRDNPAQRILPFPYFTLAPGSRVDQRFRSVRTGRFISD